MKYIGIRAMAENIYYSIIESKDGEYEVISISKIKIPSALPTPEVLSYVRNLLITIIEQYSIEYAAIRVIEPSANVKINESILCRVNIEGVIQEVFAGSNIKEYILARNINSISLLKRKYKIEKRSIKEVADELKLKSKYKMDNGKVLTSESKESLAV